MGDRFHCTDALWPGMAELNEGLNAAIVTTAVAKVHRGQDTVSPYYGSSQSLKI